MGSQTIWRIADESSDCLHYHELYDSIWGPTIPPKGYGKEMEISGKKRDLFSFEEEHNTVWYLFTAQKSGTLTFDIVPVEKTDDYDFLLFRYDDKTTCHRIKEGSLKPIRSCISRTNTSIDGRTGLSKDATDLFVHSGPGPSYVKAVEVIKGKQFLLVLDNVYPNGKGHSIFFHYSDLKKDTALIEKNQHHYLTIYVKDEKTFALIPGNIHIRDLSERQTSEATQIFKDTATIFFPVKAQTKYEIIVKKEGYFNFTTEVHVKSGFQSYQKTALLKKIEPGQSVSFNNIYFYGGEARILRESYPVLEDIIETLREQTNFDVKIIGHVNAPYKNFSIGGQNVTNQQLSENRAKAVYQYLIKHGIDPSRLSWEGKANKEMIYPYASNEDEMQANRRVEFLITRISE